MSHSSPAAVLGRLAALDTAICLRLRAGSDGPIRAVMVWASRAGDGWAWLALAIALPAIAGPSGWSTTLEMLGIGALSLPTYRLLKNTTARPRPCATGNGLDAVLDPLDAYSFPSGHTLHAVAFTVAAGNSFPALLWLLVPLTLLIALSRLALSLHYPSDVAAGAALGALIAWAVL